MKETPDIHPLQATIMMALIAIVVTYDVYGAVTGQGFVGYLVVQQMNWWGWGSTKLAMVMALMIELVPLALFAVGLDQYFKRRRRQP